MFTIVAIAILIVFMTIGCGVILVRSKETADGRRVKNILRFSLGSYISLIAMFLFILAPRVAFAATEGSASGLGFYSCCHINRIGNHRCRICGRRSGLISPWGCIRRSGV